MAGLDFEKRVAQRNAIRERMDRIGRKILVMSWEGRGARNGHRGD